MPMRFCCDRLLRTSLGKGRAFIRYCLTHQRLADTLQQCLMNTRVTSEWYYTRSPFLKSHLNADIVNHLYELNEVQFDVASHGHDLDSEWPTFARKSLGTVGSPALPRQQLSRCSSVGSLTSASTPCMEPLSTPDHDGNNLQSSPSNTTSCNTADNLPVELDQSQLRQRELLAELSQSEQKRQELCIELDQSELRHRELRVELNKSEQLGREQRKELDQSKQERQELGKALDQEEEVRELRRLLQEREEEQKEQAVLKEALEKRVQQLEALQMGGEELNRGSRAELQREAQIKEGGEAGLRKGVETQGALKVELHEGVETQKDLKLLNGASMQKLAEESLEEEDVQKDRRKVPASQEVALLKEHQARLELDLVEAREGLNHTNTAMAEPGVATCSLTAEKEELIWKLETENSTLRAELQSRKEELQAWLKEVNSIQDPVTDGHQLQQSEEKNQNVSVCKEDQQILKDCLPRDLREALRQTSEERQGRELKMAAEMEDLNRTNNNLEERVTQLLKDLREALRQTSEERQGRELKMAAEMEDLNRTNNNLEERVTQLLKDLREALRQTTEERQGRELKMAAEMEDLNRTNNNLEERVTQLLKEKDDLWHSCHALESELRKLQVEAGKEAGSCIACHRQFSWLLRQHQCRLCSRAFCYYCSNNWVRTRQRRKKERCCKECYEQRHSQAETPDTLTSSPSVDEVFEVLAGDKMNRSNNGDLVGSESEERQPGSVGRRSSNSTVETTPEDPDERIPAQDTEINLLKSGALTLSVPLSLEDVAQFVDGFQELFVKSGEYSVVSVEAEEAGPTISWVFSSEPKSISFSMVYREGADSPLEESKVLIPLTRFNAHKETIRGELMMRKPGIYSLIFDNSFSIFISKKVLYRLTVDKHVVYDGTDLP
ncbi:hypothetical protein GJAV_G00094190 [Gymnothorax javanicus]|nr:hypothetical protein GJAV_G00094190 [Gymnothorax javanicus]